MKILIKEGRSPVILTDHFPTATLMERHNGKNATRYFISLPPGGGDAHIQIWKKMKQIDNRIFFFLSSNTFY